MRGIRALGAAAALIISSSAMAGAKTTAIGLDGYCNVYTIRITGVIAVAQDTPSCSGNFGGGLVASVRDFGKSVDLALQDVSNPGIQVVLELSYPFTDGGVFTLYDTWDGYTMHQELQGTYIR